jgi:hypothetical protein
VGIQQLRTTSVIPQDMVTPKLRKTKKEEL